MPEVNSRHSVRVPKAGELVARQIRRQIVTHEVADGDALPTESELMAEFGISRPTLREAFRILESERLITIRRGARGGARVQAPSPDVVATYAGLVLQHSGTPVADVLAARVVVEAPAARLLAGMRSRARIVKQLRDSLVAVENDPDRFDDFNRLVIELTGNQALILISEILEQIAFAAAQRYPADDEAAAHIRTRATKTRVRLTDLIEAGDADGAEQLWRAYLTDASNALASYAGETVVDLLS